MKRCWRAAWGWLAAAALAVPATCFGTVRVADQTLTAKEVFKACHSSVVKITTDKGSGTGFFFKNGLLVATCYHVIEGASSIEVWGTGGKKWPVGFLYLDKDHDAAVLKLAVDSGRKPLILADCRKASTGDPVYVIGNPLGFLTQSMTSGIISAKRRSAHTDLLQTNAAVSPGSSGSPLLDTHGQALGFITFVFTEGESLNMAVSSGELSSLSMSDPQTIGQFFALQKLIASSTIKPSTTVASAPQFGATAQQSDAACLAFAAWYGGVITEEMRWYAWWNNEADAPQGRSLTKQINAHARAFARAATCSKTFLATMGDALSDEESDAFLRAANEVKDAAGDVASAQIQLDSAFRHGDDSLEERAQASRSAWIRIMTLDRRLYNLVNGKVWFDWPRFRDAIQPGSLCYVWPPGLQHIVPDPILEDGAYVAYAPRSSKLRPGAHITAISELQVTVGDPVRTWRDISNWLTKHSDLGEVCVTFTLDDREQTAVVPVNRAKR